MTLRLGILASGRGTNLQAILDATMIGELKAEVVIVASDNPKALALERAKERTIETLALPGDRIDGQKLEDRIIKAFRRERVDLVVLAGFMRLLSPTFISFFRHRIINIHPSLLPAFPGLEAQRQAIEYGVKVSGCTVHYVDEGMDTGPIILQQAVKVQDGDTRESLAERILHQEHRLLLEVIHLIAEDRIYLEGRTVRERRSDE